MLPKPYANEQPASLVPPIGPYRDQLAYESTNSRPSYTSRSAPKKPSGLTRETVFDMATNSASNSDSSWKQTQRSWDHLNAPDFPIRDLSSAQPRALQNTSAKTKPRFEFYTHDNLPPQGIVEACAAAYASDRSLANILCPISDAEFAEICASVYNPVTRQGFLPKNAAGSLANSRLCHLLLMASVGSQYLEDSISEHMRTALFISGKWYLDMAFGATANSVQRLRANMLVVLYLSLDKSVTSIEYIRNSPPTHVLGAIFFFGVWLLILTS